MTTEEKTLLAILTLAAVLVPIALGTALGWPAWSWLLLTIPLLGALGLVARNIQRRVRYELSLHPYVTPPDQVEQQDSALQTPISDVALPSAAADYDFHFSATAYWRPARGSRIQHANPGALAAKTIVDRAGTITAVEQPNNVDIVQHRLAGALGAVRPDPTGGVETWADHVQLTLSEADTERLRRLSGVRKDEDLCEHERNHERRKRVYLGEDVLRSTGSAVVWWLAQKDNDVEDTVRLIGALAQLSAAANDAEVPELFRHLVPTPAPPGQPAFNSLDGDQQIPNSSPTDGSYQTTGLPWAGLAAGPFSDVRRVALQWGAAIDTLHLDEERRALFTRHLAMVIEKAGQPDVAQEIQRRFDAPVTDKEPADLPKPDGDLPDKLAPDDPPRQESWRNSPRSGEAEQDGQLQTDEQLQSEQLEEPHD